MDQKILEQTARDFAELDLTEDRALLAELQAEHLKISDAMARADSRMAEIRQEIASQKGPDRNSVADALIAGSDPRAAVADVSTEDELRTELESLSAGRHELRNREEAKRREIDEARHEARRKVVIAADPLAEALDEEMQSIATRLAETWAAMKALEVAAGGLTVSTGPGDRAVEAINGNRDLIWMPTIDVPQEVRDVLDQLRPVLDVTRTRIPSSVPKP